jgi:electron-transferring-flavoprotein dehydrogenase
LNLPRIKGTHNAMKTGMLAAEAAFSALGDGRSRDVLTDYEAAWRKSWVYEDLYQVRNVKPGLRWGMWLGTLHGGVQMWLSDLGLGGAVPWTMHHRYADHERLRPAAEMPTIAYPKYDGTITFDKMSSVYLSNTNHVENQPVHLQLRDPALPVDVNLRVYDGPEARYCPAGVYEFVPDDASARTDVAKEGAVPMRLQINAQNCVHCKTCDIKDPRQNIHWVPPEGGGGPNYAGM